MVAYTCNPTYLEAEIRKIKLGEQLGQKVHEIPSFFYDIPS
jgi:hypothetical protein